MIMGTMKKGIYPQIGAKQINDVDISTLQRLLNAMQIQGYALDTIKHTKHLLRQFFEYCEENGFISENPVDKVKLQKRERKTATAADDDYKAIRPEARQKFLDILEKNKFFKALCLTIIYAGLRIGEILALRWRDINFEKGTINIDDAITVDIKFDREGNVLSRQTVISDTKTAASMRENPMPNILVRALKEWHTERWRMRNISESEGKPISFIAPNDLVFSTEEGKLRTYYGTRAMFDRFLKENDLDDYNIHFHTLRHTYSNMLFELGENPKVIQGLMGHKDVITTLKHYNSVDQSQYRGATDKLDGKYNVSVAE